MILLLSVAPLLVLVGLLASGRAGPLVAVLAGIAATFPSFLAVLPEDAGVASTVLVRVVEAAWLAFTPVGIVIGGLLFHAAVAREETAIRDEATTRDPGRLLTIVFFLGPFLESVTGFGVGVVFAASALRRAGFAAAPLAAFALFALMIIPWGGLGPGTALGAALAGVDPRAVGIANSFLSALFLLAMVPLFWRVAAASGQPVPASARPGQLGAVACVGLMLIAANRVLPWEVAGIVATGPLLGWRLWRADPPRGPEGRRRALSAALPYLALTSVLLGLRLATFLPAVAPFPGLPAIGLGSPMVALVGVASLFLLRRHDGGRVAVAALRRARRPVLVIFLYVVFSRLLVGAGIPGRLAEALAAAFGSFAPYTSPLLAAASGFVIGTNVGANSTMMPLQATLGRIAGFAPVLLPAVQNFSASACMVMAPQNVAIALAVGADGRGAASRPAAVWRLLWPVAPIAIAIGLIGIVVGR
jgi:lactate permease